MKSTYNKIFQVLKSEEGNVYLTEKVDEGAKIIQVLHKRPDCWGNYTLNPVGYVYPITRKGKYRNVKILASGSWENVVEIATMEAL